MSRFAPTCCSATCHFWICWNFLGFAGVARDLVNLPSRLFLSASSSLDFSLRPTPSFPIDGVAAPFFPIDQTADATPFSPSDRAPILRIRIASNRIPTGRPPARRIPNPSKWISIAQTPILRIRIASNRIPTGRPPARRIPNPSKWISIAQNRIARAPARRIPNSSKRISIVQIAGSVPSIRSGSTAAIPMTSFCGCCLLACTTRY
ncbi:hypothetical protein PVAP13_8NG300862 [Panicum virgatum]|uniref:Uncharacterized protein n=1 Tax=Panicum virgatum TaxID=38727 RepID=A0A8T0PFD5_PANVG|nr:hypothetical protein PVAP13_8NG300862 [Panicum virgatum]